MNFTKRCVPPMILAAALGSALNLPVSAQQFAILHHFAAGGTNSFGTNTNRDGYLPTGCLVQSGKTLYGTTGGGGKWGSGTVFAVNTDGTGFKTLHTFSDTQATLSVNRTIVYTNSDGVFPTGGLTLSDNTLYGAANNGGSGGNGTVFTIKTDGTGFKVLHAFTPEVPSPLRGGYQNTDGSNPNGRLVLSGGTLYGTTHYGGTWDGGTVFAVNTDGTAFTVLHEFCEGCSVISDGYWPAAGLILNGHTLYGTTYLGGGDLNARPTPLGTIFAVNTDGTGYSSLYTFYATFCCPQISPLGTWPQSTLVLAGDTFYGTTSTSAFRLNSDGTDAVELHAFPSSPDSFAPNADGYLLTSALLLSGKTLYGTAYEGGPGGSGTVFEVNTDGTGFKLLHSFSALSNGSLGGTNADGGGPWADLILSGSTLYGTAQSGGSGASGTIFSIELPSTVPQLAVTTDGQNLILSWPSEFSAFSLQSTTDIGAPSSWTTVLVPPVPINGQNTVTNSLAGPQQFFRLSQ